MLLRNEDLSPKIATVEYLSKHSFPVLATLLENIKIELLNIHRRITFYLNIEVIMETGIRGEA